jgi:hypothetical protein
LRETLEELIEEDESDEGQARAEFTERGAELLLNALSFGELQVWDVMVPRSDIRRSRPPPAWGGGRHHAHGDAHPPAGIPTISTTSSA